MTDKKAKELTEGIISIILHEVNGYSKEEIIKESMAADCEGSLLYDEIKDYLKNKNFI